MTRRSPLLFAAFFGILALFAPAVASGQDDPHRKTDRAEFDARDREARWLYLHRFDPLSPEADTVFEWIRQTGDTTLLEWLALYPGHAGDRAAAEALGEMDAPEWIRVAVWRIAYVDSHSRESARRMMLEDRPGKALAWLEKYPAAREGSAMVEQVYDQLREKAPAAVDVSTDLPPLDPSKVLADLDAPAELPELGDALAAEPGKRYAHQVRRAIDGLVPSAALLADPRWRAKLDALAKGGAPAIRRHACRAFAHVADPHVPWLLSIARDDRESPDVRADALLGYSFGSHPQVYLDLVVLAGEPGQPTWRTAVDRLADLDMGFAFEKAGPADEAALPDADRAAWQAARERVRARVAEGGPDAIARDLTQLLERAAWADLECHPLEGTLVPWTRERVRAAASAPSVRAALEKLAAGEGASDLQGRMGAVRERVQQYARKALE